MCIRDRLNSADKVFTLGKEMTPSMKNWEGKPQTVEIGLRAIDVDDHSDHGGDVLRLHLELVQLVQHRY